MGYVPAGFNNNFALNSLTVGTTGDVGLVDQNVNATTSGWTSGIEALYLLNLFGGAGSSETPGHYGILNLDGLYAFLQGYGFLTDGFYTNANGTVVDIIGAPAATPLPAALPLMAAGIGVFCLLGWRRRKAAA
jgi:hypothetical protein